jgi:hypothetical protein
MCVVLLKVRYLVVAGIAYLITTVISPIYGSQIILQLRLYFVVNTPGLAVSPCVTTYHCDKFMFNLMFIGAHCRICIVHKYISFESKRRGLRCIGVNTHLDLSYIPHDKLVICKHMFISKCN